MSEKAKAWNACQRNGCVTCRRYSEERCGAMCGCTPLVHCWCKGSVMLLFQDQAGGALLEDVPSGVCRPGEEGKSGLSGRTHSDGGLQIGSAGGCGADAAGT